MRLLFIFILYHFISLSQANDTIHFVIKYDDDKFEIKTKSFNDTIEKFLLTNPFYSGVICVQSYEKSFSDDKIYLYNDYYNVFNKGKKINSTSVFYNNNGTIHSNVFESLTRDTIVKLVFLSTSKFPYTYTHLIDSTFKSVEKTNNVFKDPKYTSNKIYEYDENQNLKTLIETFVNLENNEEYFTLKTFPNQRKKTRGFDIKILFKNKKIINVICENAVFIDIEGNIVSSDEFFNKINANESLISFNKKEISFSTEEQEKLKADYWLFITKCKENTNCIDLSNEKLNKIIKSWKANEIKKISKLK